MDKNVHHKKIPPKINRQSGDFATTPTPNYLHILVLLYMYRGNLLYNNQIHYWIRILTLGFICIESQQLLPIQHVSSYRLPTFHSIKTIIFPSTAPTPFRRNTRLYESENSSSSSSSSSSNTLNCNEEQKREFEIEQKFALTPDSSNTVTIQDIEDKLKSLGFQPTGPVKRFTDTYVEVKLSSSSSSSYPYDWLLTAQNDHWLRYRELIIMNHDDDNGNNNDPNGKISKKGAWQLKRRHYTKNKENDNTEKRLSTVYEEMIGEDAMQAVQSLLQTQEHNYVPPKELQKDSDSSINMNMNMNINIGKIYFTERLNLLPPGLPKEYTWVPFASFETIRSSWKYPAENTNTAERSHDEENSKDDNKTTQPFTFRDIKVDLDNTDFGFMVGEIEMVVHEEDQIQAAKKCIQEFISILLGANASQMDTKPALGKLETFMINHRREHYDACVQSGSL